MRPKASHADGVKQLRRAILLFLFIVITSPMIGSGVQAAASATYTVKAGSEPYQKKYETNQTYNEMTRQYYTLRSYLEQLEKSGGGTLILTKGTYVITNTLYVPSNVTIQLENGVRLVKGNDTGTKGLVPTKSLIQFVSSGKSGKTAEITKYTGTSNSKLLGEGTATIDLNYVNGATGIVLGHNSDILIEGITFQKMNNASFIRIGGSREVTIKDNTFRYHKASKTGSKEAIALEIPDSRTKSFSYSWSKNDKTVNQNITIEGNEFYQLERAVGSTKYTEGKYHKNIILVDNNIRETASHAVRILNWENCVIEKNKFSLINNAEGSLKAILASGANNPTIKNNTFTKTDRPIQIMPWKNNNDGSDYAITYNVISEQNKADMLNNTLLEMGEYCIRYNKTYNEFTLDTEKWEIYDSAVSAFTVTPASEPFQKNFTNYSTYNTSSKQYYVLRSYLEQLEKVGGGTLTLEAGLYEICNTLYVPSHVTIKLKDGVVIRKTQQTGTDAMETSGTIFQLVAPSKANISGVYGGYEGESDIRLFGEGTVIIDLNYVKDAIAIVFGHNSEIMVSNITFQNMYSGHFIELDASRSVTIENNSFHNYKASPNGNKEAINLDTPDKKTGGFHEIWTNYDCTPNKDIIIRNNSFKNLERAIGTHKYSGGKYHDNIQILNNKIENTSSDAIRILNWTEPTITGNEIKNVNSGSGGSRAILASGVIHPVITGNTFLDAARPIQIMPWKNDSAGSEYDITYNEISQDDIDFMLKNTLVRVGEQFIRVNHTFGVYASDTDKYYY